MSVQAENDENSRLDRSPRYNFEKLINQGDAALIKLSRGAQKALDCLVNKDVYLECPYAFVSRQTLLLELSRQGDSKTLDEEVSSRIADLTAEQVLLGYASKEIEANDPADFVICLSDEATKAFIARNRWITRKLRERARQQVEKLARGWNERGSGKELEATFLRANRSLHEVEVSLPVVEIVKAQKRLSDRLARDARDSYVEMLAPFYEEFENVGIELLGEASQTQMESRDADAQTYPGHPKNQWTQYEFRVPDEFAGIWIDEEKVDAEESEKAVISEEKNSTASLEDKKEELSEEELQRRETKKQEWDKLANFMRNRSNELLLDAVSFNATTNYYVNDVASLKVKLDEEQQQDSWQGSVVQNYEERVNLIDLKTIGDKYLLSAAWHCRSDSNVIVCAYLDKEAKDHSLIALWSLASDPLRPRLVLDCEYQISALSFCPLKSYSNILIGGSLDGTIVVWEIVNDWLLDHREDRSINDSVPIKEATIAISAADKSQKLSIVGIEWLPSWCRLEPDGNFQKVNTDQSSKEPRPCFATGSSDGSVCFYSLPRCLSSPAVARSPLRLTISPVYRLLLLLLLLDDQQQNSRLTSFCLPLAKSEEASSLNLRDDADLERLRKIFVGTDRGEVACFGWEGQLPGVEAREEVCKTLTRLCVHDGIVKTMAKSPHLDDVFLSVGGRVFALWKEDLAESPIFKRRSTACRYTGACWSARAGSFLLARMDGCFELWDLKIKSDEPVLVQCVSDKVTPYVLPSPLASEKKLLAVLDGAWSLRIFAEPDETADDEDLVRIEWLEEFAWRETRRKLDFRRWQDKYLREHPVAIKRKVEREQTEAARRRQEAKEKFLKILGIICIALGSPGYSAGNWFFFVAVTAFVLSVIWSMIYLFSVRESIKLNINCLLTELCNTGIYTVFYLTAFIIELCVAVRASYFVAGIFGLFNTLAYALGTYYLYLEYVGSQR